PDGEVGHTRCASGGEGDTGGKVPCARRRPRADRGRRLPLRTSADRGGPRHRSVVPGSGYPRGGLTSTPTPHLHPAAPLSREGQLMRALSDVLWRERDLLELLVHRLEVERALLETGRTARIALAARETEDVLEQYRTAELGRAAEAAASARALGRPENASLADLAQAAQGPWGDILHEHRSALRELVAQVETLTR